MVAHEGDWGEGGLGADTLNGVAGREKVKHE